MNDVFDVLKAIMAPMGETLNVTKNEAGHYDVYTFHEMDNRKPMWFGGVRIQKNYVSYYLMPVYVNPELLEGMLPELKKQMKGKSCFNFKVIDNTQQEALAQLTRRGYEDYVSKGYITPD